MAETARLIAKSWTSHANTTLGYVGADGHFVAIGDIEGHGHAPEESEVFARRLAACWNACDGIQTNELEHIANTGGMLGPREDVARIASQRDELLAELEKIATSVDIDTLRAAIDCARAALSKVKGGAL